MVSCLPNPVALTPASHLTLRLMSRLLVAPSCGWQVWCGWWACRALLRDRPPGRDDNTHRRIGIQSLQGGSITHLSPPPSLSQDIHVVHGHTFSRGHSSCFLVHVLVRVKSSNMLLQHGRNWPFLSVENANTGSSMQLTPTHNNSHFLISSQGRVGGSRGI